LLNSLEIKKADLRLLLFHGSLKTARQLAVENSSLDVIITGHEQQISDGEMVGRTIIVSPGGEGNMLGHLFVSSEGKVFSCKNEFITFNYLTDPDDNLIRGRIDEYTKIMTEKLK